MATLIKVQKELQIKLWFFYRGLTSMMLICYSSINHKILLKRH